jgi:flagellar biosynthesis/type III secretory pathway protein FliH
MKNIKEIADKFFEEQEKLNISYDSREAFIEGFKLAKEMEKEQIKKERVEAYNNGYANGQNDAYAI